MPVKEGRSLMKRFVRWLFPLLIVGGLLGSLAARGSGVSSPATSRRSELDYFKAVNRAEPPRDPQLLFLLMGQYANANMHRDGVEFFSTLMKEFEPRLSDGQKSLYLAAIGLLRAGHSNAVPFFSRIGWVRETIGILEQAKQLSGGQIFVVRWISGMVYAQLPAIFNQRKAAAADLTWCVENSDKAPHAGWLREVYLRLADLYRMDGRTAQAQEYLRLSGYADFEKPVTLTTPFAEDLATGHTYFRSLNPRLKFYARENYHEELSIVLNAPGLFGQRFFGSRFNLEDVRSFKPDVTIDRRTELKIGGTRIEFIPVQGG